MDDLDDILNEGAEPATPQPEVVETPQEPVRDESGRFAPKGDNEDAPPASDEKSKGLEAGISAERKKRQEVEQQLEALRRELEQRQPQEPQAPPPSIWEDDQAALGHVHNSAVQVAVEQATYQAKLQMSEMLVSQQFEDFATVKDKLVEFVGQNPAINQQVAQSQHPWLTAYNAFKTQQTMQDVGATNIAELEAKLREQIMAEQAQQQPAAPNLPRSLADAQSSRGGNTPVPAPLSLEDILGR